MAETDQSEPSDRGARRLTVLEPLAAAHRCSRRNAKAAAETLGLSERQIYKLVARLRAADGSTAGAGYPDARRRAAGRDIAAARLQDIIVEVAAAAPGFSVVEIARRVGARCMKLGLAAPSLSTVRRRLAVRPGARAAVGPLEAPTTLRGRLPAMSDESLVELLYKVVGNPGAWQGFVDALGQSYGSGFGNLVAHDFLAASGCVEATGLRDAGFSRAYVSHYDRLNPWLAYAGRAPVGVAVSTLGMVPEAVLRRSEFIQDWCRPQGIGGGVVVTIQRNDNRIMAVSALFSDATFEQMPDVTARLQRLTPHLLRVAQLNRQFGTLEARALAADDALARLATAMLLLNGEGHVLYLNPKADRIMAAADGMTVRAGRLETVRPAETQPLRALIANAAAAPTDSKVAPGGVMLVTRRTGRRPYEVLAAPISDTTVRLGFSGPLVAVFIREPEARVTTPVDWLRRVYGLTAAEGAAHAGAARG